MTKNNLGLLFTGLLLLVAGLISPSNGVDDMVNREPLDMLVETLIIILAGVIIYLVFQRMLKLNENK